MCRAEIDSVEPRKRKKRFHLAAERELHVDESGEQQRISSGNVPGRKQNKVTIQKS